MTHLKKLGTTTAMLTLLTSGGAFADITGAQVWGDYKSYMEGFGYTMTSTENVSGDDVTVTDLTVTMPLPEDGGTITMNYGEMSFTTNSDGTASLSIPPQMTLEMAIRAQKEEPVDLKVNYTHTDLSIVASGTSGDVTYTFGAATLGMELTELVVDGKLMDIGTADITMNNIAGTASMKTGNMRNLAQAGTIGSIVYNIAFKEPTDEGEGRVNFKGNMDNIAFDLAATMPLMADMADMVALMSAGFSMNGKFTHSGSTLAFDFADRGDAMTLNSTTTSGNLSMDMDENHLQYGGASNGVAFDMTSNELPFPVSMGMAEASFNLLTPLAKSDEEQDFSFMIKLGDFTVSDMIWGIIDGTGQLPHDPATIALDLSGKAKLFFNMMDPESAEMMDLDVPGEINSLSLNSIVVSAAGAALTGDGAFTFDNTDLTTFDGMPAPTGAVDLKLVGGNGLLDKLVAMGLLPEDQAMGARMMVGMFAVPAGDDVLTSKIEITGDGGISANGMRIK